MKCPQCKSNVDDGTAVCPTCDYVIDPSAFDTEARPSKPSSRPATKSGAKKVVKRPAGAKKPAPKVSKPPASPPPREQKQDRSDWRSRVSKEDWEEGAAKGPAPEKFQADKGVDPDAFMQESLGFINSLSSPDKLAFFGAAGMAMSCFFPWKVTLNDGDVMGLQSSGVLVFLLAGVTMVTVAIRARQLIKVSPILLWVAQLGAVGFSVLWVLVYMKLSWDPTPVRAKIGNEEIWLSQPSFGAFLALICAGVSGLGTVLGLKANPSS